jgi:hypothetical protein
MRPATTSAIDDGGLARTYQMAAPQRAIWIWLRLRVSSRVPDAAMTAQSTLPISYFSCSPAISGVASDASLSRRLTRFSRVARSVRRKRPTNLVFSRRAASRIAARSDACANTATVDLPRELTVDFYLRIAGGLPFRQRRVIEVREMDGALDLQRAVAFEKNRRRMRIDPMDERMRCGIRKKCEDALFARVGCY